MIPAQVSGSVSYLLFPYYSVSAPLALLPLNPLGHFCPHTFTIINFSIRNIFSEISFGWFLYGILVSHPLSSSQKGDIFSPAI